MADHDLRLRRLKAPNPVRTTTATPSSNHGPGLAVGGCAGGPVDASAVTIEGETDGASACIVDDGVAVSVVATDGVELATGPLGGLVLNGGGAVAGARGGGHTWLNWTDGGRLPYPEL
jgi:hypothetical protein